MRELSSDRLALSAGSFDGVAGDVCAAGTTRSAASRRASTICSRVLAEAFARERQFISDASHELKTPLTSINANAQMLLRWGDRDPAVLQDSLETIARESADLAAMVNGMLTLAKADRGDEIPKEPLSLAQIASEVTQNATPRADRERHGRSASNTTARRSSIGEAHLLAAAGRQSGG